MTPDESRPPPVDRCIGAFSGWDRTSPSSVKEERLYALLDPSEGFDTLHALLDALGEVDPDYRLHVGGAILDTLRDGSGEGDGASAEIETDPSLGDDFDNRYARLLALHSNVDLESAVAFNADGESLYRRFGRSVVRYARIGRSLETARGVLARLASTDHDVVPVGPMSEESLARASLAEGESPKKVLAAGAPRSAVLRVDLERPRERAFRRLSAVDDSDAAEARWVEARREDAIATLRFHVLNEARLSAQPSSIVFRESGRFRYATTLADMYNHARVSGRVGLGRGDSRLPSAYILPRYGQPENHYHTLVDKLPTLFGYKLLGLDCPVIAAYRPNATMLHLMDLLGIERDRVRVDTGADITAERAVVPTPERLRPLFIDFCATLPKGRSPFGPRIYIARGDKNGRGMENEREVERALGRRGFDIVRMEEHDIAAQIAISANADVIVAPHGAGMANMIFAPRGCRVLELIPERYMVRFFWQLAVDCGHRYGVLTGRMSEGADADGPLGGALRWRTDTDALGRVLDDIGCPPLDRAA